MKTFHVSTSIDKLLTLSDEQLEAMFESSASEIRSELTQRKLNGEHLIGCEDCEGFDSIKGCPGHNHIN